MVAKRRDSNAKNAFSKTIVESMARINGTEREKSRAKSRPVVARSLGAGVRQSDN